MAAQESKYLNFGGLLFLICLMFLLFNGNFSFAQNYFPIGAWCFDPLDDDQLYQRAGNEFVLVQAEKTKLTDLGFTYFIACLTPRAEQAMINFGEELNGAFKSTLGWTPLNYPSIPNEYPVWRCSYGDAFWCPGDINDPNWVSRVNDGYAAIGSVYDGSVGFHSALIGAEHNISEDSRGNEVDYMGVSVNNNITSTPISIVQEGWDANVGQFVANIPNNDIFMIQSYVFRANPPTPNSGTGFQTAVNEMERNWGDIIRSIRDNSLNMEQFAIVQAHQSPNLPPVGYNYRFPTQEEILLGVNMALAYGAKGIVYYLYALAGDEMGLLDANRNPTAKYYEVQDINLNYLQLHGPKFLPLIWQEGFTIYQNTQEPISSSASLYDLKAKPPGGSYDAESETYVEIGYFTDSAALDYYMVVDRRATATRDVEITFQGYPNAEHKVKDMFTGVETSYSKADAGSNGRFVYTTQTIEAGGGKLLLLDKAPAAPRNLDITNKGQNGQNVNLAWDASTEPDLDHYAIYRGYQDDKFSPVNWLPNPVATTSATTWTGSFS